MNGIHDLGGMQGFGPVEPEPDEPVFHSRWEARVLALTIGAGRLFGSIDARRHIIERLPPADYLRFSYYEKWLARLMAEVPGERAGERPMSRAEAGRMIHQGRPALREAQREPIFAVGDHVVARNLNPAGHTRLARYVRGRPGVVEKLHGSHVFPDTNAHGLGENPQPLYTVRFRARDLWGPEAAERDTVCIDLWEDYLSPAPVAAGWKVTRTSSADSNRQTPV